MNRTSLRRAAQWTGLAALLAGCGAAAARPCGDRGRQVVAAGATYCVYDADAVAAAGGSVACPPTLPFALPLDGAVVCTSEDGAATVPDEVCRAAGVRCDAPLVDAATPDAAGDGDPQDAGASGCPPPGERPVVEVLEGDLTVDTTWGCDALHVLHGPVYVTAGATLTLEPGTQVRSDPDAGIFVLPDGRLDASGTADAPIVLGPNVPTGMRRTGGWFGVTLLGSAPVGTSTGTSAFSDDARFAYGGDAPDHDCGTLRHVRVEFAGSSTDMSALRLGGCGRGTTVDGVQVHLAAADAITVFGGTVDLRHVIATGARNESLQWDRGWTGRAQFLFVQSLAGPAERALIRGGSKGFDAGAVRSSPTLYNYTLVSIGPGRTRVGLWLGDGTDGTLRNGIVWGGYDVAVDVADRQEVARAEASPPGIEVGHTMLFGMGLEPAGYLTRELGPPDHDGDGGFDDLAWLAATERQNRFGSDPLLPMPERVSAPEATPPLGSPAAGGGAAPPDDGFFDPSAVYLGAFEPGGVDWTAGWAAFPVS